MKITKTITINLSKADLFAILFPQESLENSSNVTIRSNDNNGDTVVSTLDNSDTIELSVDFDTTPNA